MSNDLTRGLPVDITGPVRAEVLVVAHDGEQAVLTGPDGPQPWHIDTGGSGHPLDLVRQMALKQIENVDLVHSTSWRWDRQAVILTFLVVIKPEALGTMRHIPVPRAALARSTAHEAPSEIAFSQVLEHALRHLAWLSNEDEAVKEALSDAWKNELAGYVPAPFQQLD